MNTVWHDLLANMAILALLVSIWSNTQIPCASSQAMVRQMGFGLFLGVGTIVVVLLPFQIGDVIFIDLRTTVIAVSGFFGGPISLTVTTILVAAFRLHAGGAGTVAGLTVILIAATVGMAAYYLKKDQRPSVSAVLLFSATVAVTGLFGVIILQRAPSIVVTPTISLPTTITVFASTLMTSLAITNELRRREVTRKNHIYKVVIDSLPDCLNVKDLEGQFIVANPATASLMKASGSDALIGKSDFDFYPPDIARKFRQDEEKAARGETSYIIEQQVTHRNGSIAWLSTLKSPLRDEAGQVTGVITHNRDVTAKKALETALTESERKATAALTNMADGLVMFDENHNVVFCNEQYRSMFPLTADLRVPGTPAASILHASIARGELINIPTGNESEWVNTAVSRLHSSGTVQFPLFDGRWIESRTNPAPDGTCFVVCSDITATKQSEQRLRDLNIRLAELAETDGLTGLLNRRAFDTILAQEIAAVARGEGPLSLLLLDVDRFKAFNDTYGHTDGDKCLRSIADGLRAVAHRPTDRVARYGGEEFALILPDTPEEAAISLAHKLRNRIRAMEIVHTASDNGIVTASIGVATLANHTIGPEAGRLVPRADEALYLAKASGRDLVRVWEPAKPQLSLDASAPRTKHAT